jgi:hypothetical protein
VTISVTFIDTCVLCNLLPVPGRDQNSKEIRDEMLIRRELGERFILPVSTIIETGNHIAHMNNGHDRRVAAEKFTGMLKLSMDGKAPWTLHQFEWGRDFLSILVSGCNTGSDLIEHAVAEVGAGDLCILAEREVYKNRATLHSVDIWSIDGPLSAYK